MPSTAIVALTLWRTFRPNPHEPVKFVREGRRRTYTWDEFVATFIADPERTPIKNSVAGFALAAYADNRRILANVEHVDALILDFDHGRPSIEKIKAAFPGILGVAYTTWSHERHAPRLRAILLHSRPVSQDEHDRLWLWAQAACAKVGLEADESAADSTHLYFLPSYRPGATYRWRTLEGRPLNVDRTLRHALTTPRTFSSGGGRSKAGSASRVPPPETVRGGLCGASKSFFGRAFVLAEMAFTSLENGVLPVICPWSREHSPGDDAPTSTAILPPTTGAQWGAFKCLHGHCVDRPTLDLLDVLPLKALEAARREHGRGLVRAKVRRAFSRHFEAIPNEAEEMDQLVLRCWPEDASVPIIWRVKVGCQAHTEGLDSLPVEALLGRWVDLVIEEIEGVEEGRITSGRLALLPE